MKVQGKQGVPQASSADATDFVTWPHLKSAKLATGYSTQVSGEFHRVLIHTPPQQPKLLLKKQWLTT